jgi:hypothetical protein
MRVGAAWHRCLVHPQGRLASVADAFAEFAGIGSALAAQRLFKAISWYGGTCAIATDGVGAGPW